MAAAAMTGDSVHVVVLASWYPDSPDDTSGIFFRDHARALQRSGCAVGVLAPRLIPLSRPQQAAGTASRVRMRVEDGIPTYRASVLNWAPRSARIPASLFTRTSRTMLMQYMAEHGKPDVLHAQSAIFAGTAAAQIGDSLTLPFVLHEHRTRYARGMSAGRLRLARSAALSSMGAFGVSSPFCRLLEQELDMRPGSWDVMPNIVDEEFLALPLHPLPSTPFRLLHVSSLHANKRVDLLLDAFAKAFAGSDDVFLTVGGDGPARDTLTAYAHELGLGHQVQFLGHLSRQEVISEMHMCSAFVLSSDHETFGVVLAEAMAAGKPVVSTACGGPEDLVTDQTGLLVPPGDAAELARALQKLRGTLDAYSPKTIRDECRSRFGPDEVASRWVQIYNDAVNTRAPS